MNPSLLQAYRQAHYLIELANGEQLIQVDQHYCWLDKLLIGYQAQSAILLTAYNPGSQQLSGSNNALHNGRLAEILGLSHYQWLHTQSRDPEQKWPVERGFLIFNMSQNKAQQLAVQFGQNAYLTITAGKSVSLTWVEYEQQD